MTKRMTKEEKRVTELVRRRVKESRSTELLGFDVADARRALKKNGVDYDELTSAITKKNRADRTLARQTRSRKLPA